MEALLFYIFSKYSNKDVHRAISYVFGISVLLFGFDHYLSVGTLTFDNALVIFSTIFMTVSMLAINVYMKKSRELRDEDNIFAHLLVLFSLVPFVITFTHDILSTDVAYIMASVLLLLIGYRYFATMKVVEVSYKRNFKLIVNALFLALLLIINFKYFDHDFSKFEDVFKFIFMLAMNVYVVKALLETYLDFKEVSKEENFAIVLYGLGVFIQSMFIHRYINFEFDKVILSSYFLIVSAIGILIGFRENWSLTRKLGLAAIYYSLAKFFIYDFYTQDFSTFVRMVTYFILGFILLGISLLYAYLERTYGLAEQDK